MNLTRLVAGAGLMILAASVAASVDAAAPEAVKADTPPTAPGVRIEQLDVTDHPAVDALAAKYRGRPIDLLLLNAAQGPTGASAFRPLAKLEFAS